MVSNESNPSSPFDASRSRMSSVNSVNSVNSANSTNSDAGNEKGSRDDYGKRNYNYNRNLGMIEMNMMNETKGQDMRNSDHDDDEKEMQTDLQETTEKGQDVNGEGLAVIGRIDTQLSLSNEGEQNGDAAPENMQTQLTSGEKSYIL